MPELVEKFQSLSKGSSFFLRQNVAYFLKQ